MAMPDIDLGGLSVQSLCSSFLFSNKQLVFETLRKKVNCSFKKDSFSAQIMGVKVNLLPINISQTVALPVVLQNR